MSLDRSNIQQLLGMLYGGRDAPAVLARIEGLLAGRLPAVPAEEPHGLAQTDALLICYPDQVLSRGELPLRTLAQFASEYLTEVVNTIHVLPFFPSSSDDGFSVTDYRSVDPAYGDWRDIRQLGEQFGLMFDAVINHASVQSNWFQNFLGGDAAFADFFIEIAGQPDLSTVVRPRTTPLLTGFASPDRNRAIWTTFSADQADLNYHNPEVLLRILDTLLLYVERGARFIRLDAVAYIWKERGTPCVHLPQAHAIVSLIRLVLEYAAPKTVLLTETNVSQAENIRYLGNDVPEAQLAYNFALPPLLLHAFHTAQAATLTDWAEVFPQLPNGTTMLNVLATHDGIGLNGCRGVLDEAEILNLAARIEGAGGHISRRANRNGGSDPYELNINYMDALDAAPSGTDQDLSIQRFISAHAIMLSLRGIPAIYFHSLLGSRSWHEGVQQTGRSRSINREKLAYLQLRAELADVNSLRARIYTGLSTLLRVRRGNPAFSPFAAQEILHAGNGVFALARGDPELDGQVYCLHNVTPRWQVFDHGVLNAQETPGQGIDMITGRKFDLRRGAEGRLAPYESIWLRMTNGIQSQHRRLRTESTANAPSKGRRSPEVGKR